MLNILLFILLAAYFCFISHMQKGYIAEKQTLKIIYPLSKMIKIAPLIGIIIFAILFIFILHGNLLERVSHAILIFATWLYATQFYQYILAHFKKKKILISSIIGLVYSMILAITFTPLDKYVELLYSYLGVYSIFFSCVLFILFYIVISNIDKVSKTKR